MGSSPLAPTQPEENGKMKRRIKNFAEQDAFTQWKHLVCYVQRAGVRSKIKRVVRRRERREGKVDLQQRINDDQ